MALILNIETSTEICSVCISKDDEVIALKETVEPYLHSKMITLLIEQCISSAKTTLKDLDAVAVSSGPGSYTALRIGFSTAKGICYALDKPLIIVDTLKALALTTQAKEKQDGLYCPMIDARRMEVYTQILNNKNEPVTNLEAKVINDSSYKDYFESEKLLIFSGNGAEKCKTVLQSPFAFFSDVVCSATNMSPLSQKSFQFTKFSELAYSIPNYLKSPNITTPKSRGF